MFPPPPVFPDANGVISGTCGHYGFFPHVRVYLRHGQIEKIEGGGKYGDLWREFRDELSDIQYPHFPSPGYYYLHEMALGTNPKAARNVNQLWNTNIGLPLDVERMRAGVIHWGFGLQALDLIERKTPQQDRYDELIKFGKEKDAPTVHSAHVHNYFITYDIKLRNGEWFRLIDKGWLKILDDPDVIKLAGKYGNAKEILKYEWVPAVPGISYTGDYAKDYAADPVSWVKKEIAEIMPKRIQELKVREESGQSVKPHPHEHEHQH
jgi:hypothetical protein